MSKGVCGLACGQQGGVARDDHTPHARRRAMAPGSVGLTSMRSQRLARLLPARPPGYAAEEIELGSSPTPLLIRHARAVVVWVEEVRLEGANGGGGDGLGGQDGAGGAHEGGGGLRSPTSSISRFEQCLDGLACSRVRSRSFALEVPLTPLS